MCQLHVHKYMSLIQLGKTTDFNYTSLCFVLHSMLTIELDLIGPVLFSNAHELNCLAPRMTKSAEMIILSLSLWAVGLNRSKH